MTVGIYSLFDTKTGECLYVGQSSNIERRATKHVQRLSSGYHLKSFREYFASMGNDKSRISYKILQECSDDDNEKNTLEIQWFNELQPRFYGKEPSGNEKWKHSPETVEKIRASNKNNYIDKDTEISRPKACPTCDSVFYSYRSSSIYCSQVCYSKAPRVNRSKEIDSTVVTEIIRLYVEGSSQISIANLLGIDKKRVRRVLVDSNVPIRSSHRNESNRYPAIGEILDGIDNLGYKKYAATLGVSDNAVRGYLRRRGVDLPRKHRAPRSK